MTDPPLWTEEQLDADRIKARSHFSKGRMEEPLEDYLEAFDEYQGHIREFLETTVDLSQLEGAALEVLTDPDLLRAFRYLAAPPISQDDLKVLAEAESFSKSSLRSRPEDVRRLLAVVQQVFDRRRFAWLVEGREPTENERTASIMASASLMAASRAQTNRRTVGKKQQEAFVKEALKGLGLKEVSSRKIPNVSLAPAAGEFCGESLLGSRKGDIIVRLWDHRVMPIECKVSNSYTNSVKRLNNDAAVKASSWKRGFRSSPGCSHGGFERSLQTPQPCGRPRARALAILGSRPKRLLQNGFPTRSQLRLRTPKIGTGEHSEECAHRLVRTYRQGCEPLLERTGPIFLAKLTAAKGVRSTVLYAIYL